MANMIKHLRDPQVDASGGNAMVVFDDHRFCAGVGKDVWLMQAPHMHSQIELNYVTDGFMTYRFDGRVITLEPGDFVFFWGTVPHQVIAKAEVTRFVCLYLPLTVFRNLSASDRLTGTVLNGGMVKAGRMNPADAEQFHRWHADLMSRDPRLELLVRDELSARIRRVDFDGWEDLRASALSHAHIGSVAAERVEKVERMARFISENAGEELTVEAVASEVNLHPNYAMTLFKKSIGITINQFITRARLDAAQALLVATDKDVAEIAFESGFGSLSRFYDAFHRKFGVSPAKFRKVHEAPGRVPLGKAA